ncbi:hypothetical protein BGX33_001136 [Mortierella sp. NVP41]|nr:hypothetical protein BGX33_001136 [Mortierella sp. NVP41]
MLAKSTLVALTTALALLVLDPATALPYGNPPVATTTPSSPAATTIPGMYYGFHHPSSSSTRRPLYNTGYAYPSSTRPPPMMYNPHGRAPPTSTWPQQNYPRPTATPYLVPGGGAQQQQQQQSPFFVETNSTSNVDTNSTRFEEWHDPSCDEPPTSRRHIGIDLRQNSFAVGFINSQGKVELIPNELGELYTPAHVRFIDGGRRAIVGRSALKADGPTSEGRFVPGTREPLNQVDLSELESPEWYERYPSNFRFNIAGSTPYHLQQGDEFPQPASTEEKNQYHETVPRDIMAVVLRRALDMAEAHLSEKVKSVALTTSRIGSDEYMAGGPMGIYEGAESVGLKDYDIYLGTLTLAAAHVEFFESRVQRDPNGGAEDYLPQTVLLYNLRDETEDMIVMQYLKGDYGKRPFHLKLLGGYLPNDRKVSEAVFNPFMKFVRNRFNQGIRTGGNGDMSPRESLDYMVGQVMFFHAFSEMYLNYPDTTSDEFETKFHVGPDAYTIVTFKEWKEFKAEFMKDRLSAAVDRVLASAGITDKAQIDHLVVADASHFQEQSTVALEAVLGRKAVTEVNPKTAIAEGIVTIAGFLTKESGLKPEWCN